MHRLISIENVRSQLSAGDFIAAYADAALLLLQKPNDYTRGLLLIEAATAAEKAVEALKLLDDLAGLMPSRALNGLKLQLHLFTGEFELSLQCLDASGLTESEPAYHEFAFRIAHRQNLPALALTHLNRLEEFGARPLSHFLNKFDVLKRQGRYHEIKDAIQQLMAQIPITNTFAHWQLRLWETGIAHEELRFGDCIAKTQALLHDFLASTTAQQTHPAPSAKAWTRRRQHLVFADLERLIVKHKLPVFVAAGTLLALVREGDVFINDKDIDLGVIDMSAERAAQLFASEHCFALISPPEYFVGFQQLLHKPTGMIVDLAGYHREQENIVARWSHPSGVLFRASAFSTFELTTWEHPGLRCRIPIPDNVDTYLTSMYGDWRTPDPLFDTVVAAKNLVGLTDFLVSLCFIKISQALLSHSRNTAKALVGHLQQRGFDCTLFHRIYALS